ncbi:MAG: UMP kinase [Patescibacteria group bacterium]
MKKKTIIISLGGSLIVPDKIDINFLKKFKDLILRYTKKFNFIIFTGGGKIAREYQTAGKQVSNISKTQMDWLGISASHLNAKLLCFIFNDLADSKIIQIPTKKIKFKKPIVLAGGWKPGWSTDFDAVKIAVVNKIEMVLNLSNIAYAYNKDPHKYKDAQKIEKITWAEFRKIVGNVWDPGLNMPFDPIASRLAEKKNIQVGIMNGKDLKNLENYFKEQKFKGTLIY